MTGVTDCTYRYTKSSRNKLGKEVTPSMDLVLFAPLQKVPKNNVKMQVNVGENIHVLEGSLFDQRGSF